MRWLVVFLSIPEAMSKQLEKTVQRSGMFGSLLVRLVKLKAADALQAAMLSFHHEFWYRSYILRLHNTPSPPHPSSPMCTLSSIGLPTLLLLLHL